MSPPVARDSREPAAAAASPARGPALADRATQVIALTAKLWGLRPGMRV